MQELGVEVGGTLYLLEEYVGTACRLVLSRSPRIPDRVDELTGHSAPFGKFTRSVLAGRISVVCWRD